MCPTVGRVKTSLPSDEWADLLGAVDGVEVVVDDLSGPQDHHRDVVVVVPPYLRPWDVGLLAGMPRLRLVQLLSAGYDGILERVPHGVLLANAAGVHDDSTAELALALVLAQLRGIPDFVRAQDRAEWMRPGILPSLADRRVLLLGYGSIGHAIARRLLPFGVELTVVASRAREGDELVAVVHGVDALPTLLPRHDVVIAIVPLTDSTRGLVDDGFLAAMPDGALFVNVARGPVAVTDALVRHGGRLRIAVDVTDPEPLPADHPLWHTPGVLVSPHVGGATTAFAPRAVAMLRDQLARVARGEEPRHVIHRPSDH